MAMTAFVTSWYSSSRCTYDKILRYDEYFNPKSDLYLYSARFDIVLDVMFFFGTLMELRTSFIDTDHFAETCDPAKIFRKRTRSPRWWMDLLSCFPAAVIYAYPSLSVNWLIIKLVCRLRCTTAWLFGSNSARLRMQPYWQSILRLLLLIMLLGHLLGCFWHLISTPLEHSPLEGSAGGKRWIDPEYADRPLFLYYTYFTKIGLYLALGIIVQGYSVVENSLIVVLAPLGAVVNALVLSSIIVIVSRHSALETHAMEQQAQLKQAIEAQGLPSTIQLRLMAYHTQKRAHRCRTETQVIFRGLSPQLHFELNLVLYFNLIIEADIFKKSHPKVIRQIVLAFEDKLFLPGDYICRYDDEGSEMYFVSKGMLDVFSQSNVLLSQMKKGQHFGEVALLTGARRTAYVQAKMFCMLASLSKENFDVIMKEYPNQLDVIMEQMTEKKRTWFKSLMTKQQETKDEKRLNLPRSKSLMVGVGVGGAGSSSITTYSGLRLDEEEDEDGPPSPSTSFQPKSGIAGILPSIPLGNTEAATVAPDPTSSYSSYSSGSGKAVTMVIPFQGEGGDEEEKATDGSEEDSDQEEDTSDESGFDDSNDSDMEEEDLDQLVESVTKHTCMALNGNEKLNVRLKEMCEKQKSSAETAEQVANHFERYFVGQSGGQESTVLLECLCTDVEALRQQCVDFRQLMGDTEEDDDSPARIYTTKVDGDQADHEESGILRASSSFRPQEAEDEAIAQEASFGHHESDGRDVEQTVL
jgi:voltage-gated potassium channel